MSPSAGGGANIITGGEHISPASCDAKLVPVGKRQEEVLPTVKLEQRRYKATTEAMYLKYIICYDIKEDRIRSSVVKYLENHAFRIQFSVFSCKCSSKEIRAIWKELLHLTANADNPLLMIIPVCKDCDKDILMQGKPLEEDRSVIVV